MRTTRVRSDTQKDNWQQGDLLSRATRSLLSKYFSFLTNCNAGNQRFFSKYFIAPCCCTYERQALKR